MFWEVDTEYSSGSRCFTHCAPSRFVDRLDHYQLSNGKLVLRTQTKQLLNLSHILQLLKLLMYLQLAALLVISVNHSDLSMVVLLRHIVF